MSNIVLSTSTADVLVFACWALLCFVASAILGAGHRGFRIALGVRATWHGMRGSVQQIARV
jgi:hypothetical protein